MAALRFHNRDGLALGDDVVDLDEQRFELSRNRRGDRDFHLHRLDESYVVALSDARADLKRKRANASRDVGDNLDLWHSVLRRPPTTRVLANGLLSRQNA